MKKSTLAILLLAILFIGLSVADALKWIHPMDISITNFILLFKDHLLTQAAVFISWFGEGPQAYLMLVLSAVALFAARFRWEAVVLFVSNIIGIASSELIKIIVCSPRPRCAIGAGPAKGCGLYLSERACDILYNFFWFALLFWHIKNETNMGESSSVASAGYPYSFCRGFQSLSARALEQ